MTSLRRILQGLLQRRAGTARADAPRVEYSYTIYWTKEVRGWNAERRRAVGEALSAVLARPDFERNAYERRYALPELDALAHSGESLAALQKVLRAFEASVA